MLVVGGGLSGLHTLYRLHSQGISCSVIEARKRMGGRILSVNQDEVGTSHGRLGFDLGPAWFWPGQTRMLDLINELGLQSEVFTENPIGATIFEDANGEVQRLGNGGAMAGSYRLRGGIGQIIARLEDILPERLITTDRRVTHLSLGESRVKVTSEDNEESPRNSQYVVLALPPRIAMATISFTPNLSESRVEALNNIATWMAGQAKVVVIYNQPFWREQGLSGDVMSRRGPLQEIHDASVPGLEPFALFGFVGVPAQYRREKEADLKAAAVDQLIRLFGDQAANPTEVILKDWAFDLYTATEHDQRPLLAHPSNDVGEVAEFDWQNRLIWSGTETASKTGCHNGYLEGALESSERTLSLLNRCLHANC